jgi:hypothetical protein
LNDVARAFTTPQTLEFFLYFFTSLLPSPAHTPSVPPPISDHFAKMQSAQKFWEELALTVMLPSSLESSAPKGQEVTVNFTIPGH